MLHSHINFQARRNLLYKEEEPQIGQAVLACPEREEMLHRQNWLRGKACASLKAACMKERSLN